MGIGASVMEAKFEQLAQDLAKAWRSGTLVPLPPAGDGPASRADAIAIQDRMAEILGDAVVGWKVGATVRAVQVFEGHEGPMPGRIFADRLFESPARLPSKLLPGVKVECEFAFRTTRAVPKGGRPLTASDLADALVFHPAFEVAGSHYAPGTGNRAATTNDAIADNGTSGAAVLGPAVTDWRGLPFETMELDAKLDGIPLQAYSGVYRRNPVDIMAETFNDLHARGVAIPAGTVVLTGSLTLPTPFRKGQEVVARYAQLPPFSMRME